MSKRKQIIGFIALELAMFMGTLDSTIINIALPDIMNYFKASLNDTSWISTIYVLGLSVFMIPASKLADQFGRKKVMLTGLVIFGGSSALCGFSQSLIFLIFMRMIQGIGGAIITPIVIPMALKLFGTKKTQTVAGAVGAATALAAAGGPPIGGLLIKYINWQSIFFVNVPLAAISLILAIFFVGESYDRTVSKSIDWLGMIFLTAALFLLTFSLLKGRDYGWSSVMIISMFIGSAAAFVFFLITESKVKAPLVELGLFREFTFTASGICYLITGFAIVGPLLIFNYFLQNLLGYEALKAAYIVMAVSLTVIISMPLGSMLAGRLGAKPINFLGLLFMSAGTFMLSGLTVNTAKSVMTAEMIVFGFGLGFSCQSLVSSIKYLPEEKSGIGSGVVNAARQIGTCVGIALLVSVLNSNVADAKDQIKESAISSVNKSSIVSEVKTAIISDINKSFSTKGDTSSEEQKKLQNDLENDVKGALKTVSSEPRPSGNEVLAALYDGASTLNSGADKASAGQQSLNSGIKTLSSGLGTLCSGSASLTSGLNTLNSGSSQALSGAQTLNSAVSQGMSTISSAALQLSDGAQSLSSNMGSYVSAVNSTYYMMVKTNPQSSQLLAVYKINLAKVQSAYAVTKDETARKQLMQQIQALSNLVALYTAGTDPSVVNEQQFETKLALMSSHDGNYHNVVSSSYKITAGTDQLTNSLKKMSAQFGQNNGSLYSLKVGMDKLTGALVQIKTGSDKLLAGSQKLQNGLETAKSGSDKLLSGSSQLIDADTRISSGTSKLVCGVSLAGQQSEIQNVVNKIKDDKDERLADAFDKTFLLSAIILLATSVCGLFTDRKEPETAD